MSRPVMIVLGVVAVVLGFLLFGAMYTVHQTQQALVLQFGKPVSVVRDPGLHFKMPLIQDVTYFDSRILELDPAPQEVILSDQKRINVDSFMRYRIVDPLEFRQKALTESNFRGLFGGRLNAAMRAEVGKVLLPDMLSAKRDDLMRRIQQLLKDQATEFGVELTDVRIGRTDLPQDTSQAVYNRMRSQRVAQASLLRAEGAEIKARVQAEADRERTVILAEARRQSDILRGEGEGQRTLILNKAFGQDPEFFAFYRSLEAYAEAFGRDTTMVLSPDSEFFRFFSDIQGRQQVRTGTGLGGPEQ